VFWNIDKSSFVYLKFSAMTRCITPEIREVINAVHYLPAVSIIMPFEPKMSLKTELTHSLKIAVDNVEKELLRNYPDEMGMLVMQTHIKKVLLSTYRHCLKKFCISIY
jgi:hypothetical protein